MPGCLRRLGELRSPSHTSIHVNWKFPTPIIISFTSLSFLTGPYPFRCAWDNEPVPNWCISLAVAFVVVYHNGDCPPVHLDSRDMGVPQYHPAFSDMGCNRRQTLIAFRLANYNPMIFLVGLVWPKVVPFRLRCTRSERLHHSINLVLSHKLHLPTCLRHTLITRGVHSLRMENGDGYDFGSSVW